VTRKEFERAWEEHCEELLRYLLYLGVPLAVAEELLQDACVRAFRGYPQFRGPHLRASFFKIVAYEARGWATRARRRDALAESWKRSYESRMLSWVEPSELGPDVARVLEAMAEAEPIDRMVFELCFGRGYSAAETAEAISLALGERITEAAVRMRKCRLRAHLATLFDWGKGG
jgi:DNA-directed RNA polymerase specialized sigma24 family protein